MKHKCQMCGERAVIHITDVDPSNVVQQMHFCYRHAQEHLREEEGGDGAVPDVVPSEPTLELDPGLKCPLCNLTFEEFRQVGRLGCPHDYEVFRAPLKPLLENIHGNLRHIGKVPCRLPADTHKQTELIKLRQEIQQAIAVEDYERAASLRDKIGRIESEQEVSRPASK